MITLDVKERDQLLNVLSTEQKEFIELFVKRGKKTSFANIMARDKGLVLPDSATVEEMEMLIEDWVLDDYIDNGYVNPNTPCECGKALRYQYIVRHLSTNQVRRFGITHFEEHTGLSASLIAEIKKGFTQIDYEQDELLSKIRDGWKLLDYVQSIPTELRLSKDIQQHLDVNVPLLERQIKRLKRDIIAYLEKNNLKDFGRNTNIKPVPSVVEIFETQESFNFFEENKYEVQVNMQQSSKINPFHLFNAVNRYLDEGVSSARIISELLIKHDGASNKRYITGKPKIYVEVCQYLEQLVCGKKVELLEINCKEDRIYQKLGR